MFYAFNNRYGIGTRYASDNSRIGEVKFFGTKAARDEYVASEPKAEAISSHEAQKYLVDELMSYMGTTDPWDREELIAGGMRELVAKVADVRDRYAY